MKTKLFLLSFFLLSSVMAKTPLEKINKMISDKRMGVNTDIVLIYKDGQKIFEHYGREYTPETKHLSWSTAKTIAGILIGQAMEEGKLQASDPVNRYLPEYQGTATVKDLLQMSSGIKFKEEYYGIPVNSDATGMLYLKGPKMGFANYVTSLPIRQEETPGEHFYYSSGDTNLLMEILKKVSKNKEEYDQYPWKKLFHPLGIDATFEQDASGTFVGSSYLYMKAQDFVKMGELLMQKGKWKGEQIIPESYIDLMNTVAPGVKVKALKGANPSSAYSAQVNTNQAIPERALPSEYADLPSDALIMLGFQGQLVVASPSQKLIIVRLAMDDGAIYFKRKDFFKLIKEYIHSLGFSYQTAGPSRKERSTNSDQPKLDGAKIPHLIRTLASKEYCSCRLVVKRSEKICLEDLKVSLPVLPKMTIINNEVIANLGKRVSRSVYRGPKLGCSLLE